jgi:hypothetical protein
MHMHVEIERASEPLDDCHPSTRLGMAVSRVEGPQLAHNVRPLHENGTSRSSPHAPQRKRAKPPASAKASAWLAGAQRAKAASSTNWGSPSPSRMLAA